MQISSKFYSFFRILLTKCKRVCLAINLLFPMHSCNICRKKFAFFIPYMFLQPQKISMACRSFNIIGSDVKHFFCPYCDAIDRFRHLKMYFDHLNLWQDFKNKKILHFAPEKYLYNKIKELQPQEYILADLYIENYKWEVPMRCIDMTSIPFADNYFDVLIANHILEHIPNYRKAIAESFRVMKPGGFAILQTPYSPMILYNFEDPFINTEELREFFYGQKDHVRIFGQQLFNDIKELGFSVNCYKHDALLDKYNPFYFGVNGKEDLFVFRK